MAKAGSTTIQWADYEGYFYLSTDSEKLALSLAAAGIKWAYQDETTGEYVYKLPTAWLRLRVPKFGLVKLGWYPTARQKDVLVLTEERPKLNRVK